MRLAALPLLALALTGCATPPPQPTPEQNYIELVGALQADITPEQAPALGEMACQALDRGQTAYAAGLIVRGHAPKLDRYDADLLVASAIDAYCPQHQGKVTG